MFLSPYSGFGFPAFVGIQPAGQDAAITEVTHNLTNVSGPISPGVPNPANTTQTLPSPTPLTNSVRYVISLTVYYGMVKKADI